MVHPFPHADPVRYPRSNHALGILRIFEFDHGDWNEDEVRTFFRGVLSRQLDDADSPRSEGFIDEPQTPRFIADSVQNVWGQELSESRAMNVGTRAVWVESPSIVI